MPFVKGGNRLWLRQALDSIPEDVPHLLLENENDLAGALNEGLRQATTTFVYRLDADDVLGPDALNRMLGPAWNADVVYPTMTLADENLRPFADYDAEPFDGMRLMSSNFVSGASLIRREKALEVGGFREMEALEDWDLWVRMFRAGARFKPCRQARLIYRFSEGSRNSRVRSDASFGAGLRRQIVGESDPLNDVGATFYAQATPAVTYLRAQLPAKHLPGMVLTGIDIAMGKDDFDFPGHRGKAAIYLHPGDQSRALAMQGMKAKGIRTLVEVDDNYLINPGREVLEKSNWGLNIGDAIHTRAGHRWITKYADGVIVTTRRLADSYRKVNANVFICPNAVEPSDWPEPEKPDDGIFRIAWIGSLSHKPDIPLITRAFRWASEQKDVQVYVSGANLQTGAQGISPTWEFPHGVVPWVDDLDAYRALFKHFDVCVAPIRELPFAVYRSDVKALEGAMGLAAPVLSDVAPYEDWVHGENCLKAKNAEGFLRAIKHLVKNRDETRQLAQAARDYALAERTTDKQVHLWRQAIDAD